MISAPKSKSSGLWPVAGCLSAIGLMFISLLSAAKGNPSGFWLALAALVVLTFCVWIAVARSRTIRPRLTAEMNHIRQRGLSKHTPKPEHRDAGTSAGCLIGMVLAVAAIWGGISLGDRRLFWLAIPSIALLVWSLVVSRKVGIRHRNAMTAWREAIGPPEGDSWKRHFEAEGLGHLVASTESRIRKAVRLEKKPFDGKLGTSRLGGVPDLPFDVEWPGRFLAQINLEELHAVFPDSGLPVSGHLWFTTEDEYLRGSVHYRPASIPLARAEGEHDQTACGIRFVVFEDLPEPLELSADGAMSGYYEVREHFGGGHKMLGYSNWVQYEPDEAKGKQLLLQLDTDYDLEDFVWGDMGKLYFLIAESDLKRCRFDAVTMEAQCG